MKIHRTLVLVGASLATAAVGSAQPAENVVAVELASFSFTPSTIALERDRSYVLRLTNVSSGGHDFAAPEFFAAARIEPADAEAISRGRIEVEQGQTVSVRLRAPSPGRYPIRCTHFLHSTFGMKGEIVVT